MVLTVSKVFFIAAGVVFIIAAITATIFGSLLVFPLGFALWMFGEATK